MEKLDYNKAIKISDGVYWVGYNEHVYFHTNAYLLVEDDEAVLIDPGSNIDFNIIRKKVASVIDIKKIKAIILHHQDPDLCGSIVDFEKLIPDLNVYIPRRSAIFIRHYGIKSFTANIGKDKENLKMKNNRVLEFYMTPYCHAPGSMVTYDKKNKILFSSDIFGAFNQNWELYADMIGYKKHLKTMKLFMQPYMASNEAMSNAIKKLEKLDIKIICPQHGSIMREDIPKLLRDFKKIKFGLALKGKVEGLELEGM